MPELLSTEQVDALQAVDVRLGLVHHGTEANWDNYGFPVENGPAIYGVADSDYAVPESLLSDMGPGDISARERIENEGWWGELPSNSKMLSAIHDALWWSPYVTHNPLREPGDYTTMFDSDALANADLSTVADNPSLAAALASSLKTARKLYIVDPFAYVDGLAAIKGVRRALADSYNEKRRTGNVSVEERDADMVRGLGDLAIELRSAVVGGQIPKLAFTAGAGHSGVKEILDSHSVGYSSATAARPLAEKLFRFTALLGPADTSFARYARHDARMWFKNLRAQGHVPLNENLGPFRPFQ